MSSSSSIFGSGYMGAQPMPAMFPGLSMLLGPEMARSASILGGQFLFPGNPDPFGPQFGGGGSANLALAYAQQVQARTEAAMLRTNTGGISTDATHLASMLQQSGLFQGIQAQNAAEFLTSGAGSLYQQAAMMSGGQINHLLQYLTPELVANQYLAPRLSQTNLSASGAQVNQTMQAAMNAIMRDGGQSGFDPRYTMGFGPAGFMQSMGDLSVRGLIDVSQTSSVEANTQVIRTLAAARSIAGMENDDPTTLLNKVQALTGNAIGRVDSGQIQQDLGRIREVSKAAELSVDTMLGIIQQAQQLARRVGVSEIGASQAAVESVLIGQQAAQGVSGLFGNDMATPSVTRSADRLTQTELQSRISGANSRFQRRIGAAGEMIFQRVGDRDGTVNMLTLLGLRGGENADTALALSRALSGSDLSPEDMDLLQGSEGNRRLTDLLSDEFGMDPGQAFRLLGDPELARRASERFSNMDRATRQVQLREAFGGRSQIDNLRNALGRAGLRNADDLSTRELSKIMLAAGEGVSTLQTYLSGMNSEGNTVYTGSEQKLRDFIINSYTNPEEGVSFDFTRLLGNRHVRDQLALHASAANATLSEIDENSRADYLRRENEGIKSFGTRLIDVLTEDSDATVFSRIQELGGQTNMLREAHKEKNREAITEALSNKKKAARLYATYGLSEEEAKELDGITDPDEKYEKFLKLTKDDLGEALSGTAGAAGQGILKLIEAVTGSFEGAGGAGDRENSMLGTLESIEAGIIALVRKFVENGDLIKVEFDDEGRGNIVVTEPPPTE